MISQILRDFYGIRRVPEASKITMANEYSEKLRQWKSELPSWLDASQVDPSLLNSIFQRQSIMLHLAFCHAQILVYRPFLLSDFASLKRQRGLPNPKTAPLVEKCVQAAMIVAKYLVHPMTEGNRYLGLWVR
jgi:hypothetical protein